MIDSIIHDLVELGFSQNDAAVYAALVEAGPCFVAPLVEKTKKHRQIVYNSLTTLTNGGLVSVAEKNGKNFYSLSDPSLLVIGIEKKQAAAQSLIKLVKEKQQNTSCPTCGRSFTSS